MAQFDLPWKLAVVAACLLSGQSLLSQTTSNLGTEPLLAWTQQGTKDSAQIDVVRACGPSVLTVETDKAVGSGFVVIDGKHVATCYHVIEGATKITVENSKGTKFGVESVYIQPLRDIAILLLTDDTHLNPIQLGDREILESGQTVVVIGTSLGFLTQSVSAGTYSGKRVDPTGTTVVQFTAPISPGNSGGPILTLGKKVIGLAQLTLTEGQNLNIGVSTAYIREGLSGTYIPVSSLPKPKPKPEPEPEPPKSDPSKAEPPKLEPPKPEVSTAEIAARKLNAYCQFASEYRKADLEMDRDFAKSNAASSYPERWRELIPIRDHVSNRVSEALRTLLRNWPTDTSETFTQEFMDKVHRTTDIVGSYLSQWEKVFIATDCGAPRSDYDTAMDQLKVEIKRMIEAQTELVEFSQGQPWFEYKDFREKVSPLWFGYRLNKYGLYADPDFETSCMCWTIGLIGDHVSGGTLGDSASSGNSDSNGVPSGSKIVGIRKVSFPFVNVKTWKDVADFLDAENNPSTIVVKLDNGSEYALKMH